MAAEHDWLDPEWEFLCECGSCWEHVALSLNEYDRRIAGDELILAPGHLFASAAPNAASIGLARSSNRTSGQVRERRRL
jgi:hypothetical protein